MGSKLLLFPLSNGTHVSGRRTFFPGHEEKVLVLATGPIHQETYARQRPLEQTVGRIHVMWPVIVGFSSVGKKTMAYRLIAPVFCDLGDGLFVFYPHDLVWYMDCPMMGRFNESL